MMGTRSFKAIAIAPGWMRRFGRPDRCRVPSGKTPTMFPALTSSRAFRMLVGEHATRLTGKPPVHVRISPMTGTAATSAFIMNQMARVENVPMIGPSIADR
jgi:hypothetical protein